MYMLKQKPLSKFNLRKGYFAAGKCANYVVELCLFLLNLLVEVLVDFIAPRNNFILTLGEYLFMYIVCTTLVIFSKQEGF